MILSNKSNLTLRTNEPDFDVVKKLWLSVEGGLGVDVT